MLRRRPLAEFVSSPETGRRWRGTLSQNSASQHGPRRYTCPESRLARRQFLAEESDRGNEPAPFWAGAMGRRVVAELLFREATSLNGASEATRTRGPRPGQALPPLAPPSHALLQISAIDVQNIHPPRATETEKHFLAHGTVAPCFWRLPTRRLAISTSIPHPGHGIARDLLLTAATMLRPISPPFQLRSVS